MNPPERILVRILRDLARERGWGFHAFSRDWIVSLETPGGPVRIFGYDFPLNSATAQMAAKDKSAASDLLAHAGVPRIEHVLWLRPELAEHMDSDGGSGAMGEYFRKNGGDVVIKPNNGTGGHDVHRVLDIKELELQAHRLFASGRDVCLSPYRELIQECRAIVLDSEILTAFRKSRPTVVGDGRRTLLELAAGQGWTPSFADPSDFQDMNNVPAAGERRPLDWRHNLGRGSRVELLPEPPPALLDLARRAMTALGLRFASVDVAEVAPGLDGGWRVLEINAGVMMESFARQLPDGYARVRAVYAAALDRMWFR